MYVEFPADTVKVRLQSQPISSDGKPKLFAGPVDCFRKTVQREGVRGLYRGLSSPLVGAVLENATLFVSYNYIQTLIRGHSSVSSTSSADPDQLSLPQLFTAGALAGTVASFLLTPIELVKCKLQVQEMATGHHSAPPAAAAAARPAAAADVKSAATGQRRHFTQPSAPKKVPASASATALLGATDLASLTEVQRSVKSRLAGFLTSTSASTTVGATAVQPYSGPLDVIRRTWRAHGVRGFYRGHLGTMLRETGGSAAWFGVYEVAVRQLIERREVARSASASDKPLTKADLTTGELLLAGALAGISYNVVLFPADVIKSRQQTEEELRALRGETAARGAAAKPEGFVRVGVNLYRAEGMRGLYRGCLVTVVKSTPTSAVIFGVFEWLSRTF
ncbi:hypothetical protein H9P43_007983 [Blastocladiella emersonii ATCC 22665]|nr:hypothetical protein H9P43_007983 [Blastocladiella emersonii ATCC 22665]